MLTQIELGPGARNKMKEGVDKLANAVKVTLGPNGRNVAIRHDVSGRPRSTKDGVSVARVINLVDKLEDMGAQFVKMAAEKTAIAAGDGTTTSVLLAQCIIGEGLAAVDAGANPVEIKKGIDMAVSVVVKSLQAQSQKVDNTSMVEIATISANNDREIGELVASAIQSVGNDGFITLAESKTEKTYTEKVDGIQIEKGWLSRYFVNNPEKMTTEFNNAIVVIYERKASSLKDVEGILTYAIKSKRPVLLIAEDVDGEALAVMTKNNIEGRVQCAAIRLPGFGNLQTSMLEDVAIMVGGKVISADKGDVLAQADPSFFGTVEHISISQTQTKFIGSKGKKEDIAARVAQVRALIENTDNEVEAEKLRTQRLAKLTNGVAIMYVGATTEVEMREKRDRIDDALCATRAAIEEGIVPGAGTGYIRSIGLLMKEVRCENADQSKGLDIILHAMTAPLRQILLNAGKSESQCDIIIDYVREGSNDTGFNVKSDSLEALIASGIIDPVKVSRVALENAASIGALFLTTEASIIDVAPIK